MHNRGGGGVDGTFLYPHLKYKEIKPNKKVKIMAVLFL